MLMITTPIAHLYISLSNILNLINFFLAQRDMTMGYGHRQVNIIYVSNAMRITWHPNDAERKLKKHVIRFSDAEMVLYDPVVMTWDEHIVLKPNSGLYKGSGTSDYKFPIL